MCAVCPALGTSLPGCCVVGGKAFERLEAVYRHSARCYCPPSPPRLPETALTPVFALDDVPERLTRLLGCRNGAPHAGVGGGAVRTAEICSLAVREKSRLRVLAGPHFLQKLQGRIRPASSRFCSQRLVLWPRPSGSGSTHTPLLCVLLLDTRPAQAIWAHLEILNYFCKDPFPLYGHMHGFWGPGSWTHLSGEGTPFGLLPAQVSVARTRSRSVNGVWNDINDLSCLETRSCGPSLVSFACRSV